MNHAPRAVCSGHLGGAINGASVARGSSFLRDKMGERIFAPGITIVDDPFKPRGAATRPFDGEGTGANVLNMIDDGTLKHWFLDSASARELGLEPNGRAIAAAPVRRPARPI